MPPTLFHNLAIFDLNEMLIKLGKKNIEINERQKGFN